MPVLRSRSEPMDLREIFLLMPDHAECIVRYYEAVMRGPSPLSAGERELVYAHCSWLNGCVFAHSSHKTCAVELGIAPELFDGLAEGPDDPRVPARLRPILRFAHRLTLTPGAIIRADADPIYEAGWPEQAVIDTVTVGALVGYINRVLDGFGAWLPDERHRENGRRLARDGYIPVANEVRRSIERLGARHAGVPDDAA